MAVCLCVFCTHLRQLSGTGGNFTSSFFHLSFQYADALTGKYATCFPELYTVKHTSKPIYCFIINYVHGKIKRDAYSAPRRLVYSNTFVVLNEMTLHCLLQSRPNGTSSRFTSGIKNGSVLLKIFCVLSALMFTKSPFHPQSVFIGFLWFYEETTTVSTNDINWHSFEREMWRFPDCRNKLLNWIRLTALKRVKRTVA